MSYKGESFKRKAESFRRVSVSGIKEESFSFSQGGEEEFQSGRSLRRRVEEFQFQGLKNFNFRVCEGKWTACWWGWVSTRDQIPHKL